jgi:hypothetical protein
MVFFHPANPQTRIKGIAGDNHSADRKLGKAEI